MSGKSQIYCNSRNIKTKGGNCKTKNTIYTARCKICSLHYVGKSTQELRGRINGHRSAFMKSLSKHRDANFKIDDSNCLGAHIILSHSKSQPNDFDLNYEFSILEVTTSEKLKYTEQKCIELLNTLTPMGLNNMNSILPR